jgi:hypothetical protein
MKYFIRPLAMISLLVATFVVRGQETGENQLGSWFMYFGTNKLAEKWSVHTEAQQRYYELANNFNQLLLRTGLNYHLDSHAIATFGYAYIATDGTFEEEATDTDAKEHRIFGQFILKNRIGRLDFEHRYRLEQRFLDLGMRSNTEYRARYRLQVTLPLTRVFFLNFYDEVFLNLQGNPFGQNRLYGALGIKINPALSLQTGYLKNHFSGAHFDRLQLGVFYNPDLRDIFKTKANGTKKGNL